ncbi:hypothetical protein [Paenibacillus sp. GYB003]|uniref:hypothetical protein n=1 Tax=Paenibacillus sp. GYB003 TaxID=2994392 RepID=UPI002F96980D
MSENKPQWYNDLKNGPLVSVPKPTLEIISDIERRVNSTNTSRVKKSLIWIPLAFCLVLALVTVGDLWTWDQGKDSTHSPSDYEKVFDSKGNLIAMDKKWLMSRDLFDAYRAFSESKTDEILMGMEPLDIFKMYIFASVNGDYETLYALFIQGNQYGVPSREAYLSEVRKDPGLMERSKNQWAAWKKSYRLEEEMNGTQATIRMVFPDLSSEMSFHLIKNEKDIWKVAWPPMH